MGTEKANGKNIPDWLAQLWVLEDREIAKGIAAMERDQEDGLFPTFSREIPKGNFGKIMVFGTGGDIDENEYEKMFKNPEKYNLI